MKTIPFNEKEDSILFDKFKNLSIEYLKNLNANQIPSNYTSLTSGTKEYFEDIKEKFEESLFETDPLIAKIMENQNKKIKQVDNLIEKNAPMTACKINEIIDKIGIATKQGIPLSHPGFMGFVPTGGSVISSLMDQYSSLISRQAGYYPISSGLCTLETNVINWMCDIFYGEHEKAFGMMKSGGSVSILEGVICAREFWKNKNYNDIFSKCTYTDRPCKACKKDANDISNCTIYTSEYCHHCTDKAVHIAGFNVDSNHYIKIQTNRNFSICIDELKKRIDEDEKNGLKPCCIIATVGTTGFGSIDDIEEICKIAKKHSMWVHVDGCYGGLFILSDSYKDKLKSLKEVDSISIDFHKTFSMSPGTSCLLLKDGGTLFDINFKESIGYLSKEQKSDKSLLTKLRVEHNAVNFMDYGTELTRPFRGLGVWIALEYYGLDTYIKHLNEKIKLTSLLSKELEKRNCIIVNESLSVIVFILDKKPTTLENQKRYNQLAEFIRFKVLEKQRIFFSFANINSKKLYPDAENGYISCFRIILLNVNTSNKEAFQFLSDFDDALSYVKELKLEKSSY